MGTVTPYRKTGPAVYEAMANVTGGQVLEVATGTGHNTGVPLVQPAAAGSTTVVGVAAEDAIAYANRAALENTTAAGYPVLNVAVPDELVSVYGDVAAIVVTYSADATYRQPLKADADGKVTPWTSGSDDDDKRIGWCAEPGGVTVATNAVGLARILV